MKNKNKPKKRGGPANRAKGNRYELEVKNVFVDLGFIHAKTARLASRLYDNCKIDLWGIILPDGKIVFPQCKAGYKSKYPRFNEIFLEQKKLIEKDFPPGAPELNEDNIQFLFHKLDGYKEENHGVTMKMKDFKFLFEKAMIQLRFENKKKK